MKEEIRIGIIGLGGRGRSILECILMPMTRMDIVIMAVCDTYEDRAAYASDYIANAGLPRPFCTTDYKEVIRMGGLDAVLIMTAWEPHVEIAKAAMKAGIYAGFEVGGAYSVDDCWALVRASEESGTPCMMLENCCYGQREMMILNMVRQGILGDIIHCSGSYSHDLRWEIANGEENRHYRLRNYRYRNCENYPTHELGPIAKVLGINQGNRMVSLVSIASSAKGLHEYILKAQGPQSPLADAVFAQGDVVTTSIRCAQGQTIVLRLDTTLPRPYSRGFTVHGTRGMYGGENDSLFLDGVHNSFEGVWQQQWGNAAQYEETYDHPLWQEYKNDRIGGHDGMDWLVYRAFFESVKSGTRPPIDVYDAAAWMCISALSEESIACGGTMLAIPDFTNGHWIMARHRTADRYDL
ncbi:MAG: Gfo/Idh/MocA family protein [Saccharofermentanales bacterium]